MEEFWRDFERMQQLPARFRHWLEYDANDTYQIGPIFQYHTWHRRTFAELERFMRDFSRQQYVDDYKWTGEEPPHRKGDDNVRSNQMPKLRNAFANDRQPRKSTVQVQRSARPKPRRVRQTRAFLSRQPVENDGDYYSPY